MRFRSADTKPERRSGRLLASFGLLILLAGAAKTLYLIHIGFRADGIVFPAIFMAGLALGFGGSGLHLLREAVALDIENAARPRGPLLPASGLRSRRAPKHEPL